ncbi:unnamed protein product [Dovyalis caffra]|uniref:Uncharacterized protein n=1 Tax=Dovyalis caffra TaxID=77055 RepID=A0AAV1RB57_9ROSI|nr:unnamed protein product [Dovyalis caffra]
MERQIEIFGIILRGGLQIEWPDDVWRETLNRPSGSKIFVKEWDIYEGDKERLGSCQVFDVITVGWIPCVYKICRKVKAN